MSETRTCGKCGTEYEAYTYTLIKGFSNMADDTRIDREYGNVCQDCRAEEMDPSGYALL